MSETHMPENSTDQKADASSSSYAAFENRFEEENQMRQYRYHQRGHAHYKHLYLSIRKFKLIAIGLTALLFIMFSFGVENTLSLQSEVDCLKRQMYSESPSVYACEP